jgi:hypothetical protein
MDKKKILKRLFPYFVATMLSILIGVGLAFVWVYHELHRPLPQIEPEVISSNAESGAPKVLFIGNSLTFQNMLPAVFETLVEAGLHKKATIWQVTFPGYDLEGQWKRRVALEAIERGAPWDMVVLQGQSAEVFHDRKALFEYAARFDAKIHSARAKTILFETWADKGQRGEQQQISKAYHQLASQLSASVIPIGDCWFSVQDEDPKLELYAADGHHPRPAGTYLTACEFYSYLFGKDPHGLPSKTVLQMGTKLQTYLDIPVSQATHLQNLAWNYYKAHPVEKVGDSSR